jgi:hypothetical protein
VTPLAWVVLAVVVVFLLVVAVVVHGRARLDNLRTMAGRPAELLWLAQMRDPGPGPDVPDWPDVDSGDDMAAWLAITPRAGKLAELPDIDDPATPAELIPDEDQGAELLRRLRDAGEVDR